MRGVCVIGLVLGVAGPAWAGRPGHESYFSKQPILQQQQPLPPGPDTPVPGQILVMTPQPYSPPPPPFRLHVGP